MTYAGFLGMLRAGRRRDSAKRQAGTGVPVERVGVRKSIIIERMCPPACDEGIRKALV
jgi:hypothetical protein